MNVFGSKKSKLSEFYAQLSEVYSKFESREVSPETSNKAILLIVGEYSGEDQLMSLYKTLACKKDTESVDEMILNMIKEGANKIVCIKEYRRLTGLGLKESKYYIEANFREFQ